MKIERDELSIYEVEELYKQLLEEFEKGDVDIDMSSVVKIDMSIIQLFLSAQKSAAKASKSFKLSNLSYEVEQTIKTVAATSLIPKGEQNEQ